MGAPVRRKEDKALITGAGRFTDDYTPEGTLRAHVLRSTMAHAKIKVGDLADARAMPGVRLVLTAADVEGLGGLPCKGKVRQVDGTYPKFPPHPLLVGDVVRHVGDPDRLHRRRRRSSRRRRRRRRSRSTTIRCRSWSR